MAATASGRLAIIGAGPAGLSLARLLKDRGVTGVTVFERAPRVGGKSESLTYRGLVHELGTCYSTLAHRRTNRWMRQLGVRQIALGRQQIDGMDIVAFVKAGPGPSLAGEAVRYMTLWQAHHARIEAEGETDETRALGALPIGEWLERHRLVRIRRFMLRALTNMGYGFLDEVTTCQALRWCTPGLIFSGLLNQLKMPVEGWQAFWERLAETLDVRTGAPVTEIARSDDGVSLVAGGQVHRFDQIVLTAPLDEVGALMDLSNAEADVRDAIAWGGYVTTLCEVGNWFSGHDAEAYSETLIPGAEKGALMSARASGTAAPGARPGGVYLCGQYAGTLDATALASRLGEDLARRGARLDRVIAQRKWKYFPRYRSEAVREGLITRMRELQGVRRTWYTGASFSHEAVSNIVSFNERLARRIAPALADAARRA